MSFSVHHPKPREWQHAHQRPPHQLTLGQLAPAAAVDRDRGVVAQHPVRAARELARRRRLHQRRERASGGRRPAVGPRRVAARGAHVRRAVGVGADSVARHRDDALDKERRLAQLGLAGGGAAPVRDLAQPRRRPEEDQLVPLPGGGGKWEPLTFWCGPGPFGWSREADGALSFRQGRRHS